MFQPMSMFQYHSILDAEHHAVLRFNTIPPAWSTIFNLNVSISHEPEGSKNMRLIYCHQYQRPLNSPEPNRVASWSLGKFVLLHFSLSLSCCFAFSPALFRPSDMRAGTLSGLSGFQKLSQHVDMPFNKMDNLPLCSKSVRYILDQELKHDPGQRPDTPPPHGGKTWLKNYRYARTSRRYL